MLNSVHHIALVVRDIHSASQRYAALLDRVPTLRTSADGTEHARFQLGNMALNLVAPKSVVHSDNSTHTIACAQLDKNGEGIWAIAFAAEDLTAACKAIERRGVANTEMTEDVGQRTVILATEPTFGATILLTERTGNGVVATSRAQIDSLDHVVITTSQPERAAALYGARLGLEMKLDRTNPAWNARLMFFRCGDLVVEIAHSLTNSDASAADKIWGLSWRVPDVAAARARIAKAGFSVSDVRPGRKPGTQVFTVRDAPAQVPTLIIGKQTTDA